MDLRNIVVATDESEAGRQAVKEGADLAARAEARLYVMRVMSQNLAVAAGPVAMVFDRDDAVELERLEHWLGDDLPAGHPPLGVEMEITAGIPGIEISRYAENRQADLLVLGRKARSRAARLLLGDTADAVTRRSRVPCLTVPPRHRPLSRVLAALDGTERGMTVFREACGFARATGSALSIVTVEPSLGGPAAGEAAEPPLARTLRLRERTKEIVRRELGPAARVDLEVRRGGIAEQVLAAVEGSSADVLAIGFHRGGAPGALDGGSVSRRLAHTAGCAVLTIPL